MPRLMDVGHPDDITYNVDVNIPHWVMYKKNLWRTRKPSSENIENIKRIIDLGFKSLLGKVVGGSIDFDNEASMQMNFGAILKSIGELYEFRPTDKFHIELESRVIFPDAILKSGSSVALIDITMCLGNRHDFATGAIELKFFKKSNHREPNNRYDVFSDLKNLEIYRKHFFDVCRFVLLTDHKHYYDQGTYSKNTADFDFRNGKEYRKETPLEYKTKNPYGEPIVLENDYIFSWENNLMYGVRNKGHKELYSIFLCIE